MSGVLPTLVLALAERPGDTQPLAQGMEDTVMLALDDARIEPFTIKLEDAATVQAKDIGALAAADQPCLARHIHSKPFT